MKDDAWVNLEAHREYLRRTSENATRQAAAYATFESTGWGEVSFETLCEFGLSFIEVPAVSYAYVCVDDQIVPTRYPRSFGGVERWQRNSKGFYVGANCFAIVETQSSFLPTTIMTDPNYVITHHFKFEGIAIKDIGTEHLMEAP